MAEVSPAQARQMASEQAAELSDAQVAALPNRAEEIVEALPEP